MNYLVILNAFIIVFLYYVANFKKEDKLPAGKRFIYVYKSFKAIVIIDDKMKYKHGFFESLGGLTSGKLLAKACAVGMYYVDTIWHEENFPKIRNKDRKIQECVFTFLSKENFYNAVDIAIIENIDDTVAFATKHTSHHPYDGPYGCIINEDSMKKSESWAAVPIHEFIHCMSHFYNKDWDRDHHLWHDEYYKNSKGKTLAQRSAEKTYMFMNM